MFSTTAKKLIAYIGKTGLEKIKDPAWHNSMKSFCEQFEKEVS
jgi:hypothetical protein